LKAKNYAGLCGLEYYVNAITYIRTRLNGKIHFLVFSDDMDWCKQYISPLLKNDQQTYVDWNRGANSYIDMQLRSNNNLIVMSIQPCGPPAKRAICNDIMATFRHQLHINVTVRATIPIYIGLLIIF